MHWHLQSTPISILNSLFCKRKMKSISDSELRFRLRLMLWPHLRIGFCSDIEVTVHENDNELWTSFFTHTLESIRLAYYCIKRFVLFFSSRFLLFSEMYSTIRYIHAICVLSKNYLCSIFIRPLIMILLLIIYCFCFSFFFVFYLLFMEIWLWLSYRTLLPWLFTLNITIHKYDIVYAHI